MTKRGGQNKGKVVGAKRAFTEAQIQGLRLALTTKGMIRDLALFETALSTMLRSGDLVRLKVSDVRDGLGKIKRSFTVRMEKTDKPVAVTLSETAREAIEALIAHNGIDDQHYLFTAPTRTKGEHMASITYRKLVKDWCRLIHLDPSQYSTHSLRRTRPSIMYRRTGNLRAIQLLLGHSDIGMTQRYLGIEEEDALELATQHEI